MLFLIERDETRKGNSTRVFIDFASRQVGQCSHRKSYCLKMYNCWVNDPTQRVLDSLLVEWPSRDQLWKHVFGKMSVSTWVDQSKHVK